MQNEQLTFQEPVNTGLELESGYKAFSGFNHIEERVSFQKMVSLEIESKIGRFNERYFGYTTILALTGIMLSMIVALFTRYSFVGQLGGGLTFLMWIILLMLGIPIIRIKQAKLEKAMPNYQIRQPNESIPRLAKGVITEAEALEIIKSSPEVPLEISLSTTRVEFPRYFRTTSLHCGMSMVKVKVFQIANPHRPTSPGVNEMSCDHKFAICSEPECREVVTIKKPDTGW